MDTLHGDVAYVVPRGRIGDGEILPLEFHIAGLIERGFKGVVNIFGTKGCGKTLALMCLQKKFGAALTVLDDAERDATFGLERMVVISSVQRRPWAKMAIEIMEWGRDEIVEYLLAAHREKCRSVMERLEGRITIEPAEVWAAVLEEYAADEEVTQVAQALRARVGRDLAEAEKKSLAGFYCLGELGNEPLVSIVGLRDEKCYQLLKHRTVQVALASAYRAAELREGRTDFLRKKMRRDLMIETAMLMKGDAKAMEALADVFTQHSQYQPMGVSLLLAADPMWHPTNWRLRDLRNAYLRRAQWKRADLARCDMTDANLHGIDLSEADLSGAWAMEAQFFHANLQRANLYKFRGDGGDFGMADLSHVKATGSNFCDANMEGVKLAYATLVEVNFNNANLTRADLRKADMRKSTMIYGTVDGADFSGADLAEVRWKHIDLRMTRLNGVWFCKALLEQCNLENMLLEEINFEGADLTKSYLTGSTARGGKFRGACLRRTGLAEVNWEGADLRGVDFSKASFHLGSSRSGLVDSYVASEGTRTGFYTDDYNEQDYKSPEEIRKANLRGCDLTGAIVEHCDFYLVDLRDAVYSAEQEEHFARCGAILRARC